MDEENYTSLVSQAKMLITNGKLDAAESICSRLCSMNPGKAAGWTLLGRIYQETGAFDKALKYGQQARKLEPVSVEAHIVTGFAHLGLSHPANAFKCFQTAIQLDPDNHESHFGLGVAYHSNNQFKQALGCYERALELDPASVSAHYNCGLVQILVGEFDNAIHSFKKAHTINPGWPEPVIAQAGVHEKKGEYDKASALLTGLIDKGVKNTNAGTLFAKLCANTGQYAPAIRYLESILHSDSSTNSEQMNLHFSLGALYDQAADYDAAFKHYERGNRLHGNNYNPAEDSAYFDLLIKVCTNTLLNTAPRPTLRSGLPVFIVGMPRSGTSLVEKIITKHPDAAGGGELGGIIYLSGLVERTTASEETYPGCLEKLTLQTVNDLVRNYVSALKNVSETALRVTNKLPHNFMYLALIRILFPTAPIIHCVRHPLDTSLSCYFQCFNGSILPYTYDLDYMGMHYRNYQRLMNHWKNDVGISMLDVIYEDLVKDQQGVSRQIIEYCGLEWDESCLDFYETEDKTLTASYNQVRRPMYSSSTGRWKHYEKYLDRLKSALHPAI